MRSWSRGFGRLAAEAIPIAGVALAVSLLLRAHVLEWYLVPSASMEPTLHGDPADGDVVLVDKTAFWFRRPRRFEMVVLRNLDAVGESHLVKRAVAFGDQDGCVAIEEGDVFVGETRQLLRRVVKEPVAARDMRLTHWRYPAAAGRGAAGYLQPGPHWRALEDGGPALVLRPAAASPAELDEHLRPRAQQRRRAGARPAFHLPGHLAPRLPVDTTFLDVTGERQGAAETYRDIGMELAVVPAPGCTGLQLVYEWQDRYLAWSYAADGALRFTVMGEPAEIARDARGAGEPPLVTGSAPPLVPGEATALAFGYLDGWAFLEVGGELVWHAPWPLPLHDDGDPRLAHRGLGGLVHVAAAGAAVVVPRLRVFHDVYYRPLGGIGQRPCTELDPGTMFLLGDNTFASRDSRTGRAFLTSQLIGRPLAVIGPRSRMRWLSP